MRYLSLFSGIESASVAWKPLGWTCVGVAEIEPFPCAVLAHHYPGVPNLGSVTDISDEMIAALGPIDLVVGGFPCQDLSVAGKRAGLAGARSGLFHEGMRIFHAARSFCGARYLLIENVPGMFSSHAGRDFAVVVGEMAGAEFGVPRNGWQSAGAAVGENGLVEWRTLDAQYVRVESHPRAVPQRRRRVFALLDTGDWQRRAPILLEPESLRGDSPPRRETGENATPLLEVGARTGSSTDDPRAGCGIGAPDDPMFTLQAGKQHGLVAPTIPARSLGAGGLGTDFDCDGGVIAQPFPVANTLAQRMHKGINTTVDEGQAPVAAHTLRADGFDASEDGTGRDAPLVPVAYSIDSHAASDGETVGAHSHASGGPRGLGIQKEVAHTVRAGRVHGVAAPVPVAFSCKDHGADASEIAPTLRGMGHDGSHANGGGQVAVALAFQFKASASQSMNPSVVAASLDVGKSDGMAVGFVPKAPPNSRSMGETDECSVTVTTHQLGQGVCKAMQVRRLTPRECERLQGFPDDYTLIPFRGKPAADGNRYKALGNSMACNAMAWIGQRIDEVAA
jgi:DNA (cytosine-5)-methyltransferase 1